MFNIDWEPFNGMAHRPWLMFLGLIFCIIAWAAGLFCVSSLATMSPLRMKPHSSKPVSSLTKQVKMNCIFLHLLAKSILLIPILITIATSIILDFYAMVKPTAYGYLMQDIFIQ